MSLLKSLCDNYVFSIKAFLYLGYERQYIRASEWDVQMAFCKLKNERIVWSLWSFRKKNCGEKLLYSYNKAVCMSFSKLNLKQWKDQFSWNILSASIYNLIYSIIEIRLLVYLWALLLWMWSTILYYSSMVSKITYTIF